MMTLYPDVYFTRRLRLHHIADGDDDPVWSGGTIVSALEFLVENGNHVFVIDGGEDGACYEITARRL